MPYIIDVIINFKLFQACITLSPGRTDMIEDHFWYKVIICDQCTVYSNARLACTLAFKDACNQLR